MINGSTKTVTNKKKKSTLSVFKTDYKPALHIDIIPDMHKREYYSK